MLFMNYEQSVKQPNLSRRQRLLRRFVPAVVALAGVGITGNQIKNNIEESNVIVNTYYEDVEAGSNLIQTAQEIEDKTGIDLNAAEVGISASLKQSNKANKPHLTQPGDRLVVYVNKNGEVVYSEVITAEDQKINK